jgi:stage III sporulation protein SpoIIIAA
LLGRGWIMGVISSFKVSLGSWINKIFGKKRAKIGLYGPPNAGKTTLANKIVKDWSGGAWAQSRTYPMRPGGR